MSRFDLSSPADFSRITQQSLGQISQLIDGRDPAEWDLLEGSYNGVIFHVFRSKVDWQGALSRIQDTGGRRKVKYQYPYRDGQTTDDLGRKPGSFQMEILIHGIRYMQGFRALMAEFDKPTPGILIHPVRGQITVGVEDFQIAHTNDQRKAVALNVTFIEHNFTVGNIRDLKDTSVKSKLAAALEIFKKIDATINKIEATTLFVRGVKNQLKALLEAYKTSNGQVLTTMNVAFNLGAGSNDIPALLPVNEGGTRDSNGIVTTNDFLVVRSVSDPFNNLPVSLLSQTTQQALAATQIQKQIESVRNQAADLIEALIDNGGALEFYDDIIELRASVNQVQDVFESGVASSNAQVIDYVTPRLMSLREVAFANGIPVERVQEIDILNPSLLSTNFVPKGTSLKVPVS